MMPYWFLVLLLPLAVEAGPVYIRLLPQDCRELYRSGVNTSGVYTIYPSVDSSVEVYCDMGCKEDLSRGWTVFLRRVGGSVNFNRPWEQYKNGFGTKSSEHWLGLETLYTMVHSKHYELRVDLEDSEGLNVYAHYFVFSVDSEAHGYTLQVGGFVDGGAGDALTYHNGYKFSTFDHDYSPSGCATSYFGGFWYNGCHTLNPNGFYLWEPKHQFAAKNVWYYWRRYKSVTMKILPVN